MTTLPHQLLGPLEGPDPELHRGLDVGHHPGEEHDPLAAEAVREPDLDQPHVGALDAASAAWITAAAVAVSTTPSASSGAGTRPRRSPATTSG